MNFTHYRPVKFTALIFQFILIVFSLQIKTITGQNWAIKLLLPPDYDRFSVPNLDLDNHNVTDTTLRIQASIALHSFSVHEKSQSIATDLTLCLDWIDYRLRSLNFQPNDNASKSRFGSHFQIDRPLRHFERIKATTFDALWLPNVYFRNALSARTVNTLRNIEYVEIWPDRKRIQYCTRMSVEFLCRMTVIDFPFDEHYCHFELESLEIATRTHLRIEMQPMISAVKGNMKFRLYDTFTGQCNPMISVDQFQLTENQEIIVTNRTINNNRHHNLRPQNCIYAGVRLIRGVNYYVIRYYAPTFFMIAISICSFWLPTNAWPARMYLTSSVLISLIRLTSGAYTEVPSNDVVSLFWWLWTCQLFVYSTMAEYALALAWVQFVLDKKRAHAARVESPDGWYFGKKGHYRACGKAIDRFLRRIFGPIDHFRDPVNRNKVDYCARVTYPVLLLVFVATYIVVTIPDSANKWLW